MIVVKTWVDPEEGIIGLNGDSELYLLEADGTIMEFESEEEAREFIRWNDADPDDESLEYIEVQLSEEEREIARLQDND